MLEDRILIVDDDPSWQELLSEVIEGLGPHQVQVARSYAEADALLDRQHFHLAFVDLRLREDMRDLEGKQIARKIFAQDEGTSIVIATGHADVETAITALKDWRVLDFILKDAWDPEKVARLVQIGIPAARTAYRNCYESAIDRLRGDQPVLTWVSQVLQTVASDAKVSWPDRRLSDFLNTLLDDLYPLLAPRDDAGAVLDTAGGTASARYWSKALGCPIGVRFGRRASIEAEAASLAAGLGFAQAERIVADEILGIAGAIYVPAAPPFAAFAIA